MWPFAGDSLTLSRSPDRDGGASGGAGLGWPYRAEHAVRPVVRDAGEGEIAAVEGADEHAGKRVEIGKVRKVAGRQRLPEQRPSRLDNAGLELVQQLGVAFLFGEQRAEDGQRGD